MSRRPAFRHAVLFAACLLPLPSVARAAPEGPDAVAMRAVEATRSADWASFARLMHPEALAELRRMFREIVAVDEAGELRKSFFGVETVAEFDALGDAGTFEALMKGLSANVPGIAEALGSATMAVIGVLPEGEELAHVVYRTSAEIESLKVSKTAVMTLRRHQGEWRMLLNGALEGLASRLGALHGAP